MHHPVTFVKFYNSDVNRLTSMYQNGVAKNRFVERDAVAREDLEAQAALCHQPTPAFVLCGPAAATDFCSAVLEYDVHASKDAALIVIHDDEVERTTDCRGKVRDLTIAQLKALDAGYFATPSVGNGTAERGDCHGGDAVRFPFRGMRYQIATLNEVLAAMPVGVFFSIEVKALGIDTQVASILRVRSPRPCNCRRRA